MYSSDYQAPHYIRAVHDVFSTMHYIEIPLYYYTPRQASTSLRRSKCLEYLPCAIIDLEAQSSSNDNSSNASQSPDPPSIHTSRSGVGRRTASGNTTNR